MSNKQKKKLIRILVSAALLLALQMIKPSGYLRLPLTLIPYLIIGYDVLWRAARNLISGSFLDENFLMAIASIGALAIGNEPEAVIVMLFSQIGALFEEYAVGRSRRSIASLMEIRPDRASVERNGEVLEVSPDEVEVGETILIKAGEKVPLDGVVTEGASSLDTAALTGESLPKSISVGDALYSGSVNLSGTLRVRVTKCFGESTVSKILDLVENASAKKAKTEHFISKFSKYYTPIVVAAAIAIAVIPPLFDGMWESRLIRALTFLVISCPCALVISVPLSFFGGIGGAARCGILVKGGNYLEALARVKTVVFDKTGTLTEGAFAVCGICPEDCTENELLALAAAAEKYSTHPIARSIVARGEALCTDMEVRDVKEISGQGVLAHLGEARIAVGNEKLMQSEGITVSVDETAGTSIHVAKNGSYLGHIVISDVIKEDAKRAILSLKRAGVRKTVMLTGDTDAVGQAVAKALGMDEVYSKLMPTDKVTKVETLLAERHLGTLAFVGDGINDAPVLTRADVGIAMGAAGSDAAIEASDIVIMDDKPSKLVTAIGIAKRTLRIAKVNIVFALAVKAAILLLGALGLAGMWAAVFADVGVSVIAIANAMRALSVRKLR